jgi:hypothetical protein
MPMFQIGATTGLITLYFVSAPAAWTVFKLFWVISAIVYLVVTLTSFVVDYESARKSVVEGIMFPGVVSLFVNLNALFPFLFVPVIHALAIHGQGPAHEVLALFLYSWLTLAMVVAYLAKVLETSGWPKLSRVALYIGGYGAFLCSVTFAAYVKELRGAEMKWDKT